MKEFINFAQNVENLVNNSFGIGIKAEQFAKHSTDSGNEVEENKIENFTHKGSSNSGCFVLLCTTLCDELKYIS